MKTDGINPADAAVGVKAYCSFVGTCQACGGPTNLLFNTGGRILTLACSQEHADRLVEIQERRRQHGK